MNRLRRLLARLYPTTLFGRLTIILFSGLLVAHALSLGWILYEKAQTARGMMVYYLAKDVATSVAVLEDLPSDQRAQWLDRFDRRNFKYVLGQVPDGGPFHSDLANQVGASVAAALGQRYTVATTLPPEKARRLQIRLQLKDGTPLTIELSPSAMPMSLHIPLLLGVQLLLLAGFGWLAVRQATRPLARLAHAADALTPDALSADLSEHGPTEVAQAASAFNAMQQRIRGYIAERLQMLASISHDLRTPITRMRLRIDLMDEGPMRDKLQADLDTMQSLVEQGTAYARTTHDLAEAPCKLDLEAFVDTVLADYREDGARVLLTSQPLGPVWTRPKALRRILANLVDNGLKFGEEVEVRLLTSDQTHQVLLQVQDRGPGIPDEELDRVFQPFYRVETSRNRDTGGTGLGLAIAQQLTIGLGGQLTLSNRAGGGLQAELALPMRAVG